MVPNANTRHFRLKAAQRDLIAACGGIERAAEICGYAKSTVGRWRNADSPDLMPLDALDTLEAECGRAEVTRALADLRGLVLADRDGADGANSCLMSLHAGAVTRFAEMMAEGAMAFSDNRVTPAEADRTDRSLAALERQLADYRKALAGVKQAGGVKLGGEK